MHLVQRANVVIKVEGLRYLQILSRKTINVHVNDFEIIVPAPAAGDQTKFLRGDGTWVTVDVGEIDGMLDALEERLTTMNTTVGNLQDTVNKIQEHPTVELNTRVKALEDIINDTTTGEGEG